MGLFRINALQKNKGRKKRKTLKKIFITTVTETIYDNDGNNMGPVTQDIITIAEDFTEVEHLVSQEDGRVIDRSLWNDRILIADLRGEYSGDFWLAEVFYIDQKTYKETSVMYLVQAENIADVEEIVKEEAGEPFSFTRSIEKCPWDVLGW